MEHLSKHIAEAVRKSGNRHQSVFPKDPDIEAIASFLEYKGFKKYDGPLILPRYSNYYNEDAYEIGFYGKQFSMYKCGDSAVFCILLGNHDKYYSNFGDFASIPGGPSNTHRVFYKTYDEFRDAVIEHYGW